MYNELSANFQKNVFYNENQISQKLLASPVNPKRTKYIDVRYCFATDFIKQNIVSVW